MRWRGFCVGLVAASLWAVGCRSNNKPVDGGAAGVAAPTNAPPATSSNLVPCDVAAVLKQHCVECHGVMPKRGAPLSLVSASSFQATLAGTSVGQLVLNRVQNDMMPMPPVTAGPRLTAAEIATLAGWINAGALGATLGCTVDDSATSATDSGVSTTSVTTSMPDAGNATTTTPPGTAGVPSTTGTAGMGATAPDAGPPLGDDPVASSNWASFGHDLSNTRTNPTEQKLSAMNVKGLRRAWEFKGPASTSTPAVVDGTVYLPGWDGKVRALRAEDGGMVWTSDALPNQVDTAPLVIDSSPAVSATMIFLSDNNGGVHALDRSTGKKLWSVVVDHDGQAHLWSSPVYVASAGLLVVGVASGEEQNSEPAGGYTFRGSVVGLSASDGSERWRFKTADATDGPGVSVWSTAAIDVNRKVAYIGTGNNYEAPGSKLEDSLLAIDITSGMLVWSMQFTKDDLFTIFTMGSGPDSDIGSSANLFSIAGRDAVGVGIKNGAYAALDRESGMMIWTTMLTTGSVLGGVISASAYSEGTIYVASNGSGSTTAFALDAATGKQLWESTPESGALTYGGLAYANGVVYWGCDNGAFHALDAATGKELYRDSASDSIAGSPTVAGGMVFVPWGYQWTLLDNGMAGTGGLIAYGM